jgi:hypothetical protein
MYTTVHTDTLPLSVGYRGKVPDAVAVFLPVAKIFLGHFSKAPAGGPIAARKTPS